MCVNNSKPVQPICFCIHKNETMGAGRYIQEEGIIKSLLARGDFFAEEEPGCGWEINRLALVTEGIREFVERGLGSDVNAEQDVAIVTFSDTTQKVCDFFTPGNAADIPMLRPHGTKFCLSQALGLALDIIEARSRQYEYEAREYLCPFLVVVGAGGTVGNQGESHTENERIISSAHERCCKMLANGTLRMIMYDVSKRGNDWTPFVNLCRESGAKMEHIPVEEIPGKLKGIWDCISSNGGHTKRVDEEVSRSTRVALPGYADADQRFSADSYIRGIFLDVQ